jgi:hypothetical protein
MLCKNVSLLNGITDSESVMKHHLILLCLECCASLLINPLPSESLSSTVI